MARILVIDDDTQVRRVLARQLALKGHSVQEAESARSGIDSLHSSPVDIVIVDIFMPDMDGLETIQELRKSGKDMPTSIIIILFSISMT